MSITERLKTGFSKLSEAPTNPKIANKTAVRKFDVAELYEGPLQVSRPQGESALALDEKLRQAYFWIVNNAIISPFYDIEYNTAPPSRCILGDSKAELTLPTGQSYSSFVLLPLLTLVLRRRCLFIGGPGRGKTASALLMGVLGGYTLKDLKRAIQHGQPQMTVADLLGNPLPGSLVSAKSIYDIEISWRKWLGMRVKIIDEYNRIPTRTQSALLTVLADNYAEILDHIYECPEAAWYLTANDDAGGGTYQVIEALRDRIDVVVHAHHFNTRFLGELLRRVENEIRPEQVVPKDIIFTEEEIDRAHQEILKVALPAQLLNRIEFFASHFEFLEYGGVQFENRTKDTAKTSGVPLKPLLAKETGKDKALNLGGQTLNGLSVRAIMTILAYVKAMAYLRGESEVSFEDVRQMIPFVLHDKLVQYSESAFLDLPGNDGFRSDKVAWIRHLFDLSCKEYDRLDLDSDDPVRALSEEFDRGLDGLPEKEVRKRLAKLENLLNGWAAGRKLYPHLYDNILKIKYLHQRYTNYLSWLEWKS